MLALAREDRVMLDLDFDKEIARRSTPFSRFTLAGKAECGALVNPRGHSNGNSSRASHPASPMTIPAGIGNGDAFPAA